MVRAPGKPTLMIVGDRPRDNGLLSALPAEVLERLLPGLQRVNLPLGAVLYESGGRLDYLYFPTSSIVSLLYVMEDGSSAEIAVVGHEGVLGVALFMGGNTCRTAPWCSRPGRPSASARRHWATCTTPRRR